MLTALRYDGIRNNVIDAGFWFENNDFEQARRYYPVTGAVSGPGTPVYLTPRAGATAPVLSTTASGAIWGYTVPKVGESGVHAAGTRELVVRPAQV